MSKRIAIITSLLIMLSGFFSGCASITRGTFDSLEVRSDPAGALVKVTRTNGPLTKKEISKNQLANSDTNEFGPLVNTTPAAFKLNREGEYLVEVSKAGYETLSINVKHKTSGAGGLGMAGNVLVGGIIGGVVDANTGATQDLTPNPIDVKLVPQE